MVVVVEKEHSDGINAENNRWKTGKIRISMTLKFLLSVKMTGRRTEQKSSEVFKILENFEESAVLR